MTEERCDGEVERRRSSPASFNPAPKQGCFVYDGLALAFAMVFPALMSWIEFVILPAGEEKDSVWMRGVFGLSKLIQFSFPLIYVGLREGWSWGWLRPNRNGIRWGILFGLFVCGGAFLIYFPWLRHTSLFADTPDKVHHILQKFNLDHPLGYGCFAGFIVIPHSFLEEYYWRWFVFGRLKNLISLFPAMALSALSFMAHHVIILGVYFPDRFWIGAVPFSLCVAGGGFIWAWLYHHTHSLYGPWLSHLLVDLAIVVIGYDMLAAQW